MLFSTPTSSCPCRSKCSTASEPISPLLPVTSTFIRSNYSLQRVAVQIKLGIAANHIPEMAENWNERAASSLEEYQQSTRFLTVQGEAMLRALRGANDFERRARGAQRTFVGCPQVIWHSPKKFESEALFGREFSDALA